MIFAYLSVEFAHWCYRFEAERKGATLLSPHQTRLLVVIFGSLTMIK